MATDALARFSEPARTWFRDVFASPTPVQEAAWQAISRDRHALVVAPTGSGKTLAAFFWALDRLQTSPPPADGGTRVLYVSPLKALGVDVERNLRAPLTGIAHTAERLGHPARHVTVGVRSGDTSAKDRAALVRRPPDILITTPESLYLMLTSAARSTLASVQTVIVDEIHAVAATKRGTHLALSLERLDALSGHDVQRVALSATVRPIETVASFLGGDRHVDVVAPPSSKSWDVHVELPVADITDPPALPDEPIDPLLAAGGTETVAAGAEATGSLWPHVEADIYGSVLAGRSTIVFTNSRRVAERLTARLNDMWAADHDPASLAPLTARGPAQIMAASDEVGRAPAVIARAHHGSVSKANREQTEAALKSGELRCVVATSSLELGIDMGAVDRVIQVGAPPSIASALQRIGRAGHDVGATSIGDVYPMHRGDLIPSAVATEQMLHGNIEQLRVPRSPLDVLAQQTLAAAVASGDAGLDADAWYARVRRSMPYAALSRDAFDAVVELLIGRYPSADFGELRARLSEAGGRLYPLPGSLRLATTSGGTIPDRGMFGVFLAGEESGARRVGELDEEMVYESRVGDTFALGASSWRIVEITRDQVLVVPAPGHTGRLPFWRGDGEERPAELGRQIGRFAREALRSPERLAQGLLRPNVRSNISSLLTDQREATGAIPDDRTLVLERFRDEVGDWRFVLHSPLGRRVLSAWALAIGDALERETSIDASPMASDDGIIWRLPDSDVAEQMAGLIAADPDEVTDVVTRQVGGTALFAGRFRECAARALLLPRRDPRRRAPLWQQRQRAHQLLEVARAHPRFPIILETVREVLQDVYDLPGLVEALGQVKRGQLRLVEVTTDTPSPMAASMLFRYTGAFLYDGDAPLAERRAAALSVDPQLLAAVLGTVDLRELLDERVLAETEAELQHTTADRWAHTVEALGDMTRLLGPIPLETLPARLSPELGHRLDLGSAGLSRLARVVAIGGREHLASVADLGLLRDGLGVPVPAGAAAPTRDATQRDPLTQLIARYARTHAPFTASQVASAFALGQATAGLVLEREVAERRLTTGRFTPGRDATEFCDPHVLRRIRTRCLALARAEVQAVSQSGYARFLLAWHGIGEAPESSPDEVLLALQRLAGAFLPSSSWESQVLPVRLTGYQPAHLDALIAEGEVIIRLRPGAGASDPLVALIPAADAVFVDAPAGSSPVSDELAGTSGLFTEWRALRDQARGGLTDTGALVEELWVAAEAGEVAPGSMAPVRARTGTGKAAHRAPRPAPRRRAKMPRAHLLAAHSGGTTPPQASGRWYPVRPGAPDEAARAIASISGWVERFGLVTRGAVTADNANFAAAYQVMRELEAAGKLLRGYLVEGLGGAQFGPAEIIDQLRDFGDSPDTAAEDQAGTGVSVWPSGVTDPEPLVLAAADPANPYGAILGWPGHASAHPSRAAGAVVVLVDGLCVGHLTRGGRQLTLFGGPRHERAGLVTRALLGAVGQGRMSRVRIEQIDGDRAGSSDVYEAMIASGARVSPQGLVIAAR
ncbi:MAG: DEAD/DEAH box helicase [Arachnia sp.]